jgi:cytosol alanyl aminopeptidase
MKEAMLAAALLANNPQRDVAGEPMGFIGTARDWLYDDPIRAKVEAYGQTLFHPAYTRLGWERGKTDDADKVQLRSRVIEFLAGTARDPVARAEAKKRGLLFLGAGKDGAIHREAVDANLVGAVVSVAGEDADVALWESVLARLAKTDDTDLRGRLLTFLVSAKKPELIPRVRTLAFDPALRAGEVTAGLWVQLREPDLRHATWQFVKDNFDKLLQAVPKHHGQTQLISMGGEFCDEDHAKDIEAFFTPARIAPIDGAPRVLAGALEAVRLCAAKRKAQETSLRDMFGKHK